VDCNAESQGIYIGNEQSRDNYGSTPLIEAAKGGHKEMIFTLPEAEADVNVLGNGR